MTSREKVPEAVKRQQHWEKVRSRDQPQKLGWYRKAPAISLSLIEATGIGPDARILDVGGGASTLVDGLLDRGFEIVEVLRYGPREFNALLGESFHLLDIVHETHLTPGKRKQRISYFRLQREG